MCHSEAIEHMGKITVSSCQLRRISLWGQILGWVSTMCRTLTSRKRAEKIMRKGKCELVREHNRLGGLVRGQRPRQKTMVRLMKYIGVSSHWPLILGWDFKFVLMCKKKLTPIPNERNAWYKWLVLDSVTSMRQSEHTQELSSHLLKLENEVMTPN